MTATNSLHPLVERYLDGNWKGQSSHRYITKEILESFSKTGDQSEENDPIIVAKYFTPDANWTWFATQFDPENGIYRGFVRGTESEWGNFALQELAGARGAFGLPVERDMHFTPKRFSELPDYETKLSY